MAQQEEKQQTDAEIAKLFLGAHYPSTVYAQRELQTYNKFEEKARKNMFLQAVRDGETEIALKLVLYDLVNVGTFDGYGNTALHYSSYFNRLDLIDFILKCNDIDINQQNTSNATPLHLGCEMKNIQSVSKLINANGYNIDINAVNCNNWTALHFACFVNIKERNNNQKINDDINIDLISLLIQKGCNINIKTSSGKTAFDLLPTEHLTQQKTLTLQNLLTVQAKKNN